MRFLLGIISLSTYLEGLTRIQKIAFLAPNYAKDLQYRDFYRDWAPNKYGPFSATLASDINYLTGAQMLKGYKIKNEFNYSVTRYAITEMGKNVIEPFINQNKDIFNKLKPMLERYAHVPLMSLLHDVYYQFPAYIVQSTIKGKVSIQDSSLSEDYDYPSE